MDRLFSEFGAVVQDSDVLVHGDRVVVHDSGFPGMVGRPSAKRLAMRGFASVIAGAVWDFFVSELEEVGGQVVSVVVRDLAVTVKFTVVVEGSEATVLVNAPFAMGMPLWGVDASKVSWVVLAPVGAVFREAFGSTTLPVSRVLSIGDILRDVSVALRDRDLDRNEARKVLP